MKRDRLRFIQTTNKKKTETKTAISIHPGKEIVRIREKQNGHETDLEMSPRPLGTTIFEEI